MDEEELITRLEKMSEEERAELDPICEALQRYHLRPRRDGGRVLPNRIVALAAVDLMVEYERRYFERV